MKNKKPDLILSGINLGYNLAGDVFYSGTVAAALEGAERGILSIPLSQAYDSEEKINPSHPIIELHKAYGFNDSERKE